MPFVPRDSATDSIPSLEIEGATEILSAMI
jgi:hypothetical protein